MGVILMLFEKFKLRRKNRKQQLKINQKLKKQLCSGVNNAKCCYCQCVYSSLELTIEHLIPLSYGGSNDISNIALACKACNNARGRETWMIKKKLNRDNYRSFQ